jgi:hypothetical protein
MAFKEGVTDEQVGKFNAFVEQAKALQSQVYEGKLTPDEAVDKAVEALGTFEGIVVEDKPAPAKKTKAAKEAAD